MRPEAHRIAARLDRHHHAPGRRPRAQTGQRGADRGGMVREIVVDANAIALGQQFEATLDAAELRQRRDRSTRVDARGLRCGQRRERIEHVVATEQGPVHHADLDLAGGSRRNANRPLRSGVRAIRTRLRCRSVPPASSSPSPALRASAASSPLTISRPLPGTVRTR
jgi:hypothetical protein